jgi:hypothetical protein
MTITPVLLGHLAATGWFAEHGEVALTAGLTFCLEKDPSAAEAFTRLIRERTGQAEGELRLPDRWQAEAIDEDRTRVDVAGWLDTNTEPVPVVFVEAKVSAAFAPRQVSHYAESQQRRLRNAGLDSGALVVLVPESRVRVAREEVDADLRRLGVTAKAQCWVVDGTPRVAVTVLTWDKAIQVMLDADGPAASDLEQLLGACRALANAAGNATMPNAAPHRPKTGERLPVGTPPQPNADASGGEPGSFGSLSWPASATRPMSPRWVCLT